MQSPSLEWLGEENRLLKKEVNRLEDLLATSRAERDGIGVRYNAISERLEAILKRDRGDVSVDDVGSHSLVQQNIELRRKLEEEHTNYKRKLQQYQDGQARQAQLVQKLQAKILQYKNRCLELEEQSRSAQLLTLEQHHKTSVNSRLESYQTELEKSDGSPRSDFLDGITNLCSTADAETAMLKLEDEQRKVDHLNHVNGLLREQLDQATAANQTLSADLHRLIHERDDLETNLIEWKKEAQSFNDYYVDSNDRLMTSWNCVNEMRHEFANLKAATQNDLASMISDFNTMQRNVHASFHHLLTHLHKSATINQANLEKEKAERTALENELDVKTRELVDMKTKFDFRMKEISLRNKDMTAKLSHQLEEKERAIENVRKSQTSFREDDQNRHSDRLTSTEKHEIKTSRALRRIAQEVVDDEHDGFDENYSDVDTNIGNRKTSRKTYDITLRHSQSLSPDRMRSVSHSPARRRSSPPRSKADSTVFLFQEAINKSQMQIMDLNSRLGSIRAENETLRKQLFDGDCDRRDMERQVHVVKEERDKLMLSHSDSKHQIERLRSNVDAGSNEVQQLEETNRSLTNQIASINAELKKLQAMSGELKKERELREMEKEDLLQDLNRHAKDIDRWQRLFEQSEEKVSRLKEDLVMSQETVKKTSLQKDVAEKERDAFEESLSNLRQSKSLLEMELNKVKSEDIGMKDEIHHLEIIIDNLKRDKLEIMKLQSQLENERKLSADRLAALEQENKGLRDDLLSVKKKKVPTATLR